MILVMHRTCFQSEGARIKVFGLVEIDRAPLRARLACICVRSPAGVAPCSPGSAITPTHPKGITSGSTQSQTWSHELEALAKLSSSLVTSEPLPHLKIRRDR
jgi:hypothetical protein